MQFLRCLLTLAVALGWLSTLTARPVGRLPSLHDFHPVWSAPKIPAGVTGALRDAKQFRLVNRSFDRIAYSPRRAFDIGPAGQLAGLNVAHLDDIGWAGLADLLGDAEHVAYVATDSRTDAQLAGTLAALALRLRTALPHSPQHYAPVWHNPKIPAVFAGALEARGQLDFVDRTLGRVAYYPWEGFDSSTLPEGEHLILTHTTGKDLVGLVSLLPTGEAAAYIATKGQKYREVADTLSQVAERVESRVGSQPATDWRFVSGALMITFCLFVTAVVVWQPGKLVRRLTKATTIQEDDNMSRQHSMEAFRDGSVQEIRPDSQNPFLDLPPVEMDFSKDGGWFGQSHKRRQIRSQCETYQEQTKLVGQMRDFHSELSSLGSKRYELSRICDRAVVDDLTVKCDAAEVSLKLTETEGQIRNRTLLHDLEFKRDGMKLELETAKLECEIAKTQVEAAQKMAKMANNDPSTRMRNRLEEELRQFRNRVEAKAITMAAMEATRLSMLQKYPEVLHAAINLVFYKAMNQFKEENP